MGALEYKELKCTSQEILTQNGGHEDDDNKQQR
jgi:hypothetical protein